MMLHEAQRGHICEQQGLNTVGMDQWRYSYNIVNILVNSED